MSRTKNQYGLIGWPVAHSVSPAMMNAAFAATDIDAHYELFPIEPDGFDRRMPVFLASGVRGFNVTIPHKQAIVKYLAEVTPEAKTVGAVNTVFRNAENGGWVGHNTDMDGWWQSIHPVLPRKLETVTVLGAGGAARAALAALARYHPGARVHVAGRQPARIQQLVNDFAAHLEIAAGVWENRHTLVSNSELIVHCTPIGMWPDHAVSPLAFDDCLGAGQVVQDMVYRPLETALLRQARVRGATVVDGLGMLVHQGALAFSAWFGQPAPVSVMDHAARRALGIVSG